MVGAALFAATACRGERTVADPTPVHVATPPAAPVVDSGPALEHLAFGSCLKQDLPMPILADIVAAKPELFLMIGDNVYAEGPDERRLRAAYDTLAAREEFTALREAVPLYAIWDDHDYGINDVGAEYPKRAESQQALLDFLGEPAKSARRGRAGTHASYVFGEGDRQVKLILLDGRFNRDQPSDRGDTLGKTQWAWLESELSSSTARINLIASGYQVLPLEHSNEKWGNFPVARRRLLDLIQKTRTPGVVFLSGDRHFSELSCLCDGALPYPIFELTSSGLTHSYENADEPNRFRVGDLYGKRNFGAVRIDWASDTLSLETHAVGGEAVISHATSIAKLTG